MAPGTREQDHSPRQEGTFSFSLSVSPQPQAWCSRGSGVGVQGLDTQHYLFLPM